MHLDNCVSHSVYSVCIQVSNKSQERIMVSGFTAKRGAGLVLVLTVEFCLMILFIFNDCCHLYQGGVRRSQMAVNWGQPRKPDHADQQKCQITPPVQLPQCKIANFLINKSTELPNLHQGQTKQVVSVECQFLRVH